MLKTKNIKFIVFLFLGVFLFKWVYDFFGGTEALDLINKKKNQVIFIGISTHTYSIF